MTYDQKILIANMHIRVSPILASCHNVCNVFILKSFDPVDKETYIRVRENSLFTSVNIYIYIVYLYESTFPRVKFFRRPKMSNNTRASVH